MTVAALPLLDSFSALADPTRCRMLSLLDQHELTVSELCAVLRLPQSTMSRHLKTLAEAGWVTSRRDGTSRYYTLALDSQDGAHGRIWELTRTQLAGRPGVAQDARRLLQVLAQRSATSQQFFATSAGQWDRLRSEMFGDEISWRALLGLLPHDWVVGDLGCGTGALLEVLAPHVRHVIGIDASDEMLTAAQARVHTLSNVEVRRGMLELLPLEAGSLDAAVMMLVLHHVPSPVPAMIEARRVLKPGGRLLIVDMAAHEHEEYRQQMGHVWLGFSEDHMRRLLEQAGFLSTHLASLAPATHASGPTLFTATARTPVDLAVTP